MRRSFKLLLLLGVASLVAGLVLGIRKITLSEVVCTAESDQCVEGITGDFADLPGQPLVYAKQVLQAKLAQNVLVKSFTVSYKLPNSLAVAVVARQPAYAFWAKDFRQAALVDTDGVVVGYSNAPGLPTITVESATPSVGQTVSQELLSAEQIYAKVALLHPISEAKFLDGHLSIKLADSYLVLFPLDSDTDVLVGSLALLLARLNSQAQEFTIDPISTIDLRFGNPVLK